MRKAIVLSFLLLLVCVGGIAAWKLHFWTPAGTAIKVGAWQSPDAEVEVWLRKTPTVAEPFALGLFVKQSNQTWLVFCLDHQAAYGRDVILKGSREGFQVFRHGKEDGFLNLTDAKYVRASDNQEVTAVVVRGSPPGNWWLTGN